MARDMKKYEDDLSVRLKDQEYAVEYLNAVLEDAGDDQQERFLVALKDVAKAHGVASIARESNVAREALYRVLSDKGNPELATLLSVLSALGLKLRIDSDKAS
jgi:probable addiction module antidote protein